MHLSSTPQDCPSATEVTLEDMDTSQDINWNIKDDGDRTNRNKNDMEKESIVVLGRDKALLETLE